MKLSSNKIIFLIILLLAAFFRLYGVNWDQNQHLHPDERFLTMVSTGISWPATITEYFNTYFSPLNPHNRGFGFFVYGTFPIFLTKVVSEYFNRADYINLTLIGRQISAFVDLGTVFLVYLITKQLESRIRNQESAKKLKSLFIIHNSLFPVLAAFFYAVSVLSIQLSHFYATDTFVTFFTALTFYLLIKIINYPHKVLSSKFLVLSSLLGLSFGLGIASKISTIYFIPIIILAFFYILLTCSRKWLILLYGVLFSIILYFTVRIFQPYLFVSGDFINFTLNPKVIANWKQLESFTHATSGFPPGVQWIGIKPFLFPFASIMLWGLGLPLGLICLAGYLYITLKILSTLPFFFRSLKARKVSIFQKELAEKYLSIGIILLWTWVSFLFLFQAFQPAPTIRYFHPIYPFLAIFGGLFLEKIGLFQKKYWLFLIIFLTLLWPLSFLAVYNRPHSRVLASEWIYNNIPKGSTIGIEHWDDGLPLSLNQQHYSQLYKFISLPLYDPDTIAKWQKISSLLSQSDYIVLTSNRLWASITKVPDLYPIASQYYRHLFNGSLGFEKIAEVTSFPTFPLPLVDHCLYLMPTDEEYLGLKTDKGGFLKVDSCDLYQAVHYQGIVIRDERAEETFTVYDHPKVLIFKKVKPIDYISLLFK